MSDEKVWTIYRAHFRHEPLVYVGQTSAPIVERWGQHVREARVGKSTSRHMMALRTALGEGEIEILRAGKSFGGEFDEGVSVVVETVATAETQAEADELEALWIGAMVADDPKYGTNSNRGRKERDQRRYIGFVEFEDGFFADAGRRLRAIGATPAAAALGVQALAIIAQSIGFESYRSALDVRGLGRALELNAGRVSRVLHQLEEAGLIHRLREGRSRPIILNPRLVYRGGNKAIDGLVRAYDEAVASLGNSAT